MKMQENPADYDVVDIAHRCTTGFRYIEKVQSPSSLSLSSSLVAELDGMVESAKVHSS